MANIPSQIKRNRQNEKRRLRNRGFRGAARTAVKDALASMTSDQDSPAAVALAIRTLDRAARKGAIHHRNAARRKSRLLARLASMGRETSTAGGQAVVAPTPKRAARAAKQPTPATEPKAKSEAKKPITKTASKKSTTKKPTKK